MRHVPQRLMYLRTHDTQFTGSAGKLRKVMEPLKCGALLEEVCYCNWALRVCSIVPIPVCSLSVLSVCS